MADRGDVETALPPTMRHGDLLECLLLVARTHGELPNRDTLLAGLPVEQGVLTPALFERAARNAHLSSHIVRTPVPKSAPAKLTLSSDALFDFAKSDLRPEGRARLDALVDQLTGVAIDRVIAVGHTDSIGSDAYNNRLSVARADSVKNYLVSKGMDPAKIRASGKGKTQPVADNGTAEGRSRNRRVDIEVVPAAR